MVYTKPHFTLLKPFMPKSNQSHGYLLVATSAVFFGLMGPLAVICKNDGLNQSSLLLYRFFFAFLLLFLFCCHKKAFVNFKFTTIAPAFFLGAAAYFLQSYFYFSALDFIGVGLTSILLYIYPALVVLILWLVKSQKPSLRLWIGIALAFIGVALCFVEETKQLSGSIGIYLALAAALTYSCYLVLSESILNKTSPLLVSTFVCLGAACKYFLKIIAHEEFTLPMTSDGYLALLALTVLSTVIGILFIFKGIEQIGAAKASILSSLEPVTAVLLGSIFWNESITPIKILGFILVLLSVFYISQNKTKN